MKLHPEIIEMIREELNVKELVFTDDLYDITIPQLKLNLKTLRKEYKNKETIHNIQQTLEKINSDIRDYFNNGKVRQV